MAEMVLMTALSPTMEEGTIVRWNKKEGDQISAGDVLCEVETDKATMDYEATQEGTLLKIVRPEGSASKVGETIAVLGEQGEDVDALLEEGEKPVSAETARAPVAQTKPSGAPSPGTAEAPSREAAAATRRPPEPATAGRDEARIKASPLARKIAAERGMDLGAISGSGPGGRIVKADVESFTTEAAAPAASAAAGEPGENVTIPVAGKRAVIARRLAESKFSAPHYYLKNSIRMDATMQARQDLNAELPQKVGFNAFLIKFVAEALKRHPLVNASWQGDHILQFGSIDIGLAVDTGNGLITPIVRNCGNKGIVAIDRELKDLIAKAASGKLQPEEYTGATFTISNLGSFGIEEFTAIINPPGSAILAVGEIVKTVVVGDDDEINVARIMKMTLSCDHRVIDGAAGGRFLSELKRIIEHPIRVLF